MEKVKLSRIVIKPTLACTADCPFCNSRRSLHKGLIRSKMASLDQWKEVLTDAKKMGAEYFVISGGEPTLYRYLTELVEIGKQLGLTVTINTNGSLMSEERVKKLLDAGLDSVCISLHSHLSEVHDAMKCEKGVWEKATKAIRIFSRLTKTNPGFSLQTQAILCRENFMTFSELIRLHYELGSQIMRISYLEGDFEKKYLLKENELREFKSREIPRMLEFCKSLAKPLRERAENTLKNLYPEDNASLEEYAKGIYRPKSKHPKPCEVPGQQAGPILANGDVHPCNIVEYSHEPVMGNIFHGTFPEIWNGEKWNRFRTEPFDYCQYCPMMMHPHIVFRTRPVSVKQRIKHSLRGIQHAVGLMKEKVSASPQAPPLPAQ